MRRVRATVIVLAAAAAIAVGTAQVLTAQAPPAAAKAKPAAKPADQPATKPADQTAKPAAKPAAAAHKHVLVTPSDIKWGPAPPSLPPGAEMAVLSGDPGKAVPFVIRAKFPDGYRVAPHWHPTDENLVVLSGSFVVGMGDKVDEGSMTTLAPGSYVLMPKTMHHYANAKGETIIQVHGVGPFVVNYVNPDDDPRKKM